MASMFEKIQKKAEREGFDARSRESKKWYYDELKNMIGVTERKILNDDLLIERRKPLPGRMFMYGYDPKHADSLEYYDTFPLIIMVGPAKKGFYGINLHYLHPRRRAKFFDIISKFLNNTKYDKTTRFRMTYAMLNSHAVSKEFRPCFKHYLFKHVKTRMVMVPAEHWELALFLPSDNFQKSRRTAVWTDSKNQAK